MDDHDPLAHNIAEILPEPTARTQSAEEIAAECGVLGVKEVPAGADASQVSSPTIPALLHDLHTRK